MEKLVNRLAFTKLILVAKIEDWFWTWKKSISFHQYCVIYVQITYESNYFARTYTKYNKIR